MFTQADREKLKKTHIPDICRYILAVVFIFSGFIKTIDPWGTVLKMGEYLTMLHMEWLMGWKVGLAIWLCAAELMMGCMLMFRVRLRLISVFSVLSMTVFTILTFVLAVWNPIDDCGCFGDTIHLSNWQSLGKNLVLWPMSAIMWWSERDRHFFPFSKREGVLTIVFMTMAGALGYYCYRHLPLIDLLPFKKGTNIALMIDKEGDIQSEIHSTVVCRNIATGEQKEFELNDTTWYDESKWEYMETRIDDKATDRPRVGLADFTVSDSQGDVTEQIISSKGTVHLLCLQTLDKADEKVAKRFARAIDNANQNNEQIICLTSSWLDSAPYMADFDGRTVRCYNTDPTVLNIIMRAKAGIVTLHDGTIVDKRSVWDIR